jgi:hypothetical protein
VRALNAVIHKEADHTSSSVCADHMAPLRPKEKAKAAAKQAPKAALAAGEGGNTSAPRAITSFFAAAPAVAEEKEMETDGADE